MKTVSLFSGGLDSICAVLLMKEQGHDVIGVYIDHGFNSSDKTDYLKTMESKLGISIKRIDISKEYIDLLKNPKHGFGKNLNPCVDCHAKFIKVAWNYAKSIGAHFLTSGEVLGQRGMSQTHEQLKKVNAEIGEISEFLVRPLSGKIMKKTLPEKYGWVDRDKMLSITGRGRKKQMELVAKLGITNYETPGGGCLLTDKTYSKRLRLLFVHNIENYNVAKYGRFFLINDKLLIVGRNQDDNIAMEKYKDNFIPLTPLFDKAPFSLLEKNSDENTIKLALDIISRYTKIDTPQNIQIGDQIMQIEKIDIDVEKYMI